LAPPRMFVSLRGRPRQTGSDRRSTGSHVIWAVDVDVVVAFRWRRHRHPVAAAAVIQSFAFVFGSTILKPDFHLRRQTERNADVACDENRVKHPSTRLDFYNQICAQNKLVLNIQCAT